MFGIAMWFVPNPLMDKDCPQQAVGFTHGDTIKVLDPYPVFSETKADTVKDTVFLPIVDVPILIEKTTEDSLEDGTWFKFTSETLLEGRGDTLVSKTTHKWDIQPRPLETTVIHDTSWVPKEVPVPSEVPFYEKPAIVAPVVATVTAILVKYLIK